MRLPTGHRGAGAVVLSVALEALHSRGEHRAEAAEVAVAAQSGLGPLEAAGGRSAGGRMDQGGAHGCRGRHVLLSQSHGSGIRAAAAAAPTAGGRGSGTAQEANPPPPPPAAGRAERAGLGGGRRCHSPRGARAPEPGGKEGGGARPQRRRPVSAAALTAPRAALPCPAAPARRGPRSPPAAAVA